jgi:diguanylate cyclase (GGDEF)-like protein
MSLADHRAVISQAHNYYSRLIMLVVLLLILSVGSVMLWSIKDADNQFNSEADSIYRIIDQRFKHNDAVLGGFEALLHAVDDVDYDQLSLFARQMLSGYPYIYSVSGQVRVAGSDIESFVNNMKEKGYLTYQIRELVGQSKHRWRPVSKRQVYYPIVFVEPLKPDTAQLLGYDVHSDANQREALNKAIETGDIIASAPYKFIQGGFGYTLYKPVYAGISTPKSKIDRFEQATRVISLSVKLDQLLTKDDVGDPLVKVTLAYKDSHEGNISLTNKNNILNGVGFVSHIFPGFSYKQSFQGSGRDFQLIINKPITIKMLRLELVAIAIVLVSFFAFILHMRQRYLFERRKSQEDIFKHRDREAATLLSIADAVITTDDAGKIEHMNTTAEKLTEWSLDTARGNGVEDIFKIVNSEAPTLLLDPVGQCLRDGRVIRLVKPVELNGRLNTKTEIEVTVSPTRNRDGRIIGAVLVFHDVSIVREMQDHIDYQASHDSLTGLFHRREFESFLQQALDSAHKEGKHHALCYMDIDQFRVVNESFGHLAGDELLIQVSALLRSLVRDEDKLARLGGDEFSVLLLDCPLEEAVNKAETIGNVIDEFRFVWQGKTINISLAISIVSVSSASGSVNEILRAAESACYSAKAKGRGQMVVYQSDDPELLKRRGEMRWATRISDALRNQKFRLYYQEILPIQKEEQEYTHCELLMRTETDEHELISPESFIPAAERYNLMSDIDRWVVSTAIQTIKRLEKGADIVKKSSYGINLSGQSLSDESFFDYVSGLFKEYEINPECVCFEVTETTAIVNEEIALNNIQKIKDMGCRFALDDFGTGVSSYSYLKKYPFDYVKIDGSFIRHIQENPLDRVMVESVCRIAKTMNIKTIAEYVEDRSILQILRDLGVDYAQGYGIAEPAPLQEMNGIGN